MTTEQPQKKPQRGAPSYYHWSMDKPSTTNATYGFYLKDVPLSKDTKFKGPKGPFDYTRPFSNSGFFPQLTWNSRLTDSVKPRPLRPSKDYSPGISVNKFDINKGYSVGHTPVTAKFVRSSQPLGVKLSRNISAPAAYNATTPRGKDLYLWHTLAGTLVHCKNYPPEGEAVQA